MQDLWDLLSESQGTDRADVLLALSEQAHLRGSGVVALALAQEAIEIHRNFGDGPEDREYINALIAKSQSLKLLNRDEEAIAEMEIVIQFHRRDGCPFLDDFLRTQANWLGQNGKWEAALKCQLEAVKINEVDDDPEWLAFSLRQAAHCHTKLNNFEAARNELKLARDLYKKLRKVTEVGECDLLLARCYLKMEAFEFGLECAERAEDIARSSINFQEQGRAYLILIQIHLALGDLEKAKSDIDYVAALASTVREKDWELLLEVQEVLSLYYRAADSFDQAKECERRAATIREILG